MKKWFTLFLTILMAFTFAACAKDSTDNKSNSDTKNSETAQKVSTLEILYNSYQKYTTIGKPIEGMTKIISS